jgi:hypothetical protein
MIPCVIVQILIGVKVQDTCTHQFMEQMSPPAVNPTGAVVVSISLATTFSRNPGSDGMIRTALVLAMNTHEQETPHAV